jgi:hypothetical protein
MNSKLGVFLLAVYFMAALAPVPLKWELGKMDHLIHHYFEHKQEVPGISLIDFFSLHYGDSYDFHQDDHAHTDLPGKGDTAPAHAILSNCVFSDLPQGIELSFYLPQIAPQFMLSEVAEPISAKFYSGIWQPPRC